MAIPDGKPATDFSAMNREWVRAVADEAAESVSTGLPPVTDADNGKILGVVNGAWGAMDAGGGGSSDLSTAEVTVVAGEDTTLHDVGFFMNFTYNDIYWISDDFCHVLAGESETIPITGEGTILLELVAYSDDQETPINDPVISVSGDITYDSEEGTFLVTGDGTITITAPN